jgi:hypothetical protein
MAAAYFNGLSNHEHVKEGVMVRESSTNGHRRNLYRVLIGMEERPPAMEVSCEYNE